VRVVSGLDSSALELEVAPSGEALLAVDSSPAVQAFERPAGAARFRRVRGLHVKNEVAFESSATLANDGSALIAWRFIDLRGRGIGVRATTRAAGGPFTSPTLVHSDTQDQTSSFESFSAIFVSDKATLPEDDEAGRIRTAVANGRALITWATSSRTAGGDAPAAVSASLGSTGGRFAAASTLRSPCRGIENAAALALSDGGLATVFSDNQAHIEQGGFERPVRAGRLHLALPGLASAPAPPPAVHLSVKRPRKPLGFEKPLRVNVRCSSACDARIFVPSARGLPRALGEVTLGRAGRRSVRVAPYFSEHVAPRHGSRVRVVAHACARGGTAFSSDSKRIRLRRPPLPRLPRIRGLRAIRHGRRVIVTWHTRRRVRAVAYEVSGLDRDGDDVTGTDPERLGHGRFRAVLRDRRRRIVRVEVLAESRRPPNRVRTTRTRVR
jgi:hypothetical protein